MVLDSIHHISHGNWHMHAYVRVFGNIRLVDYLIILYYNIYIYNLHKSGNEICTLTLQPFNLMVQTYYFFLV